MLPKDVPEFSFINLYGTDITAARQVERANLENRTLLLNILPEPIADRLRAGDDDPLLGNIEANSPVIGHEDLVAGLGFPPVTFPKLENLFVPLCHAFYHTPSPAGKPRYDRQKLQT